MNRSFVFAQAIALVGLTSVTGCNLLKPPEDRELRFDPALMRSPPEVDEVSIELLVAPIQEGNARLLVRFKDTVAQRGVVIQGGAGPTLLRDDGLGADERAGDGLFSAFVSFDAKAYEAEHKRRAGLAREFKEVPVFRNRALVGTEPLESPRDLRFEAGKRVVIPPFPGFPFRVAPHRELLITATSVVEDQNRTYDPCTGAGNAKGPWTFGTLMTEMANNQNPSDFTLYWLQRWTADRVINSFTVPNRASGMNPIINNWPKVNGKLDLTKAPFRLLAIVNRIDLRGSTAYGSGNAGEARFVFGWVRCDLPTQKQNFTVIFEYGIKKSSCQAVRDWAQQWRALGSLALIVTGTYNDALQKITDQFTLKNADPSKPNGSALNQLRTNETALLDPSSMWELREFKICGDTRPCALGNLEEVTVAQTPDASYGDGGLSNSLLKDFINHYEAAILAGKHLVPLLFPLPPGSPFRGGATQPALDPTWSAPGINNPLARHDFALATCDGCHTVETGTDFVHIAPRDAGSPAALSDFLTGGNPPPYEVDDPDPSSSATYTFHELLDRQMKLDATASMICPLEDLFPWRFLPPGFPH